jgi:hypothetical protein
VTPLPDTVAIDPLDATMLMTAPPPGEWHDALIAAGFVDVAAWSGFDRSPLTDDSPDSVWLATRPIE